MTLLVSEEWAATAGVEAPKGEDNGASFEVVIPGVMHALRFSLAGKQGWVLHMRLDAASDENRVQQLDRAAAWVKAKIKAGQIVIFGGDRNHTLTDDERGTSGRTRHRTTAKMRSAWHAFMETFAGRIVAQPEFTWFRIGRRRDTGGDGEEEAAEEEDDDEEEEEEDDEEAEKSEAQGADVDAEAGGSGALWQAAIPDIAGTNAGTQGVDGW